MIELDFQKNTDGLLPAIVQDHKSGEILMLAYINEASWKLTLETGRAHYWSRSRKEIWRKGQSSGHEQEVHEVYVDCDKDAVLFKVRQLGDAACHTGYRSCFHHRVEGAELQITGERIFDPQRVYGDK